MLFHKETTYYRYKRQKNVILFIKHYNEILILSPFRKVYFVLKYRKP